MLSAEKQCCLVLLCLQGCLGSLEGPSVEGVRASSGCIILLPSMLWGWQPRYVAQRNAQNRRARYFRVMHTQNVLSRQRNKSCSPPVLARDVPFPADSSMMVQRAPGQAGRNDCHPLLHDPAGFRDLAAYPACPYDPPVSTGCIQEGDAWSTSLKLALLRHVYINKCLNGMQKEAELFPSSGDREAVLH